MKQFYTILFTLFLFNMGYSQTPYYTIEKAPNQTLQYQGDLSQGAPMSDLSWAWNSSNACFPATQKEKFTGNHVLYVTEIPAHSEMEVRLIPTDPNHNMSIYAYQSTAGNPSIVPNLPGCVRCEADHKRERSFVGKEPQDHTRLVKYLTAINNPFSVVIGVAGAEGLSTGAFVIEIKTTTKIMNNTKEVHDYFTIESAPNQTLQYNGDLSQGQIMNDLSWAWNSSNACFPETQASKFTGSHVLYVTTVPKYSEMEITVIPTDPNDDFSIYAYMIGTGSDQIVPFLPGCIRCEAEHKWDRPKKGKSQDHTRTVKDILAINKEYKVVIGVAGANGLTEGAYKLQIATKSR